MSFRLIDPDEKLDFTEDWSSWLDAGVTISSASWSIDPTEPTLSGQVDTVTTSTIYLSGCTLGVVYRLQCRIVTNKATPQTAERTITLRCEHR